MTKIIDIYALVHRITGRIARTQGNPLLATNSDREAELRDFLDHASHEIGHRIRGLQHRERILTRSGEGRYGVSASMLSPIAAEVVGGNKLTLVDGYAALAAASGGEAGDPEFYGIFGDDLWVAPVPSSDGELMLYYRPNGIIAEDDEAHETTEDPDSGDLISSFRTTWKQPIADYLVGRWLMESDTPDLALPYLERWERFLVEHEHDDRGARTSRIVSRYF
jgi:hypothetical protein